MKIFIQLILDALKDVYVYFKQVAPNLLAMLTIILLGFLLARILRSLLRMFLRVVKFDSWSDRMGITAIMRKGGVWAKPAEAIASIMFWLLLLISIMAGLSALKIPTIAKLINEVILYLPNIFSALLILLFGYILAGFIARAVLITAVNSGYQYSKLLAEIVRLLLTVLILAMALEQLNVAPSIVIAAFSIIFGGIILALAISFGVGGIDSARKMLDKDSMAKEEKKDIEHI